MTIDEHVDQLSAKIAAATTLEELSRLENEASNLGGSIQATVRFIVLGTLYNKISRRGSELLNKRRD